MRRKKIGIIGGVGALPTAKLYSKIMDLSNKCYNTTPSIFMHSIPLSVEIDKRINEGRLNKHDLEYFKQEITTSSKVFNENNVDIVAMPCNSLHIFENHITDSINGRFFSMPKICRKKIISDQHDKIAILGTRTTTQSSLYDYSDLNNVNSIHELSMADQSLVNALIERLTYDVNTYVINDLVHNISQSLIANQVSTVVLACSELSLTGWDSYTSQFKIIDPLLLLSDSICKALTETNLSLREGEVS